MPVAFGDFRAGYLINDRIGTRVLRDPYTNKPFVRCSVHQIDANIRFGSKPDMSANVLFGWKADISVLKSGLMLLGLTFA